MISCLPDRDVETVCSAPLPAPTITEAPSSPQLLFVCMYVCVLFGPDVPTIWAQSRRPLYSFSLLCPSVSQNLSGLMCVVK